MISFPVIETCTDEHILSTVDYCQEPRIVSQINHNNLSVDHEYYYLK